VPGFFKDKTKLLLVPKKFWKSTRTKAFGPNFSSTDRKGFVSIQNLFQKRIYSIFFGTKASKRMLSILKERWFDIASSYFELKACVPAVLQSGQDFNWLWFYFKLYMM
jgi:hypothetical protein